MQCEVNKTVQYLNVFTTLETFLINKETEISVHSNWCPCFERVVGRYQDLNPDSFDRQVGPLTVPPLHVTEMCGM